tara:strand:+ start:124963 stop:125637 length:675 start_codon:yes stop_codon:yes gene_type:complete
MAFMVKAHKPPKGQGRLSVTGYLAAVMKQVMIEHLQSKGISDKSYCFMPADVRSKISQDKQVPVDEMANFGGSIFYPFDTREPVNNIWSEAITITGQLIDAMSSDYLDMQTRAAGEEYAAVMREPDSERKRQLTKGRDNVGVVSNLGKLLNFPVFNHLKFITGRSNGTCRMMAGRKNVFWLMLVPVNEVSYFEFYVTPGTAREDINFFATKFMQKITSHMNGST